MKIELSEDEAKILLKAIGTRKGYLKNHEIPYLKTKEFIEEDEAEIVRLNVIKVAIQTAQARARG